MPAAATARTGARRRPPSVARTPTVTRSPQRTATTSRSRRPSERSPAIRTVHAGTASSANDASADACGSDAPRTPSPSPSTKATTVSGPRLAPGSTSTALPAASVTACCVAGFAPATEKRTVRPASGAPAASRAVAVNAIGTPCGPAARGGVSWNPAGAALRTLSAKPAVAPGASGAVSGWSHSTPPALSDGVPSTPSVNVGSALPAAACTFPHTSPKASAS